MADKKALSTQPSLIGKKIYLRPATAEDIANYQYWFLQSEPQFMSCHPLPFLTVAEASEQYKKIEKSENKQKFAIVDKETNTMTGVISFFNFNHLNRSAELGILIDPDTRKKGYATDAMRLLIKYLFLYRGLNKVYAETADFNNGTIKLLEKIGFKKDGTLRNHHFYNGEFHNKLVYSFLRFELDW